MSNTEDFPAPEHSIIYSVKIKELTPKQALSMLCSTCGAAIDEVCELHSGAQRTEPHRERERCAAAAVDAKSGRA
jgi:hypothetical protein